MVKLSNIFKVDGWQNIITGFGTDKDKRRGAVANYDIPSEYELEALYASDEMAAKIIDITPDDAMSEGFRLTSKEVENDVLDKAMDLYHKFLVNDEENMVNLAWKWGRLYGGSALIIGAMDGSEDLEEPLNMANIQSLRFFSLLNRYELSTQNVTEDPNDPNYGKAATYLLVPRTSGRSEKMENFSNLTGTKIHHTRLIRFDGKKLPRHLFITNDYWHDSILNALQDDIRDYQVAHGSAAMLLTDFAQAIFKMKNLADIVMSPDGKSKIQDRLDIVNISRSVLRAVVIDSDSEDFERKSTPISGLPETLDRVNGKFVSATEYTHTVLLGESPKGGLSSKGDSEKKDHEKHIRRMQTQVLKPRLMRIFKVIFAAKDGPTGGQIPKDLDIQFNPLEHLSQVEMLDAQKTQADIDDIYIKNGVVDPSEVAMSRYGSGEYSFETEIDETIRKMPEEMGGDPEPDPELTPPVNPPGV